MPRPAKGARLWFDRKAGLWYIRDGTTKRGTGCGLEDRGGAEIALQAFLASKYQPPTDARPSHVTVADVLAYYGREIAPRHRSKGSTGVAIASLLRWWGARPLSDVKRSTCQAYVRHRMEQPNPSAKTEAAKARLIKESTAGRELTVLRAAINAYHAETPLDALPVVWVPPVAPGRTRWLTRSEAARLLSAIRTNPDKANRLALSRFILLGLYTGTRSGALRQLGWTPKSEGGWVDLKNGVIHRRGEDERETKKRRPPVRIPRRLRHFLERWHRADRNGGRPIDAVVHYKGRSIKHQRDSWAWACAKAGLGSDVTAHTLRHTAVTWMLQAGVKPWDAANFAGMSVQVLEDVYGHHHPDFQVGAADTVGRR